MLRSILEKSRQDLLRDLQRLLGELRVVLVRAGVQEEDQKALARSITQLDELFLLVVVGEFNAGKSAFINALLGEKVLEEGVTPTTSRIELVKHGEARGKTPAGGDFEVVTLPLEILREMSIVDTPGTNAVLRGHEALTRDFVPRADLVLFVTSADRPFTESERAFLETIKSWGKKVVVVINKTDILEGPDDLRKVSEFLREQMRTLLGLRPEVFAVSAKRAFKAKAAGVAPDPRTSGFGALETFLTKTLDDSERLRLKLQSPTGVAARVLDAAFALAGERLAALDADKKALREVDERMSAHREDFLRDCRPRLSELEKAALEAEKRGEAFLDSHLRLVGVLGLTSVDQTRADFEHEVAGPLGPLVERKVDGIAEALSGAEARLWPAVTEALRARQALLGARLPGGVTEPRPPDRTRRLAALRREAQRAQEAASPREEARRLARAARAMALASLLLVLAAFGLGAFAFALDSRDAAAAAGLGAGLLAAAGLLLPSLQRRRERARLSEWSSTLGQRLSTGLRSAVERELDGARQAVSEAGAPLARFVRSEEERLRAQRAELEGLRNSLGLLRARVEGLR
jgi:small GTP-binding protein